MTHGTCGRHLLFALVALATPALGQHAGHANMESTSAASPDPHASHTMPMPADKTSAPPVAPPPAESLAAPAHAADTVFPPAEMAVTREQLRQEHGAASTSRFIIDRLEHVTRNGGDGYDWDDVQFWYGGDLNKLWLKSAGAGTYAEGIDEAELQALWSRAISPFFDVQTGVRYDFRPEPERAHLVLGLQGLAPYWFEIDAAAFLSEEGDLTGRIESEYDLRITQKLILQPRAELALAAQDVPELAIGSGLSAAGAGMRLRYEYVPEFAPYVGVAYDHAFGDTADLRRADGEDAGGWSLVVGVRAWF